MNYDEKHYDKCVRYSQENKNIPFSVTEPDRQWKVHTCFKECRDPNAGDEGFEVDTRKVCEAGKTYGLICLNP